MPECGGPATQSGTYFQNTVAAWFMARMLHETTPGQTENRVIRVRCEAPEEVDDVVVTFERGVHYIQVKEALSASESAWTGLWRHFWRQFDRIDLKRDRLILWGGQHTTLYKGLQEMVRRAQSVPPGPRRKQVAEFTDRLTRKQLAWLGSIAEVIRGYETEKASGQQPVEVTPADALELLRVVDVIVKGNAEEIENQAVNTFLGGMADGPMVFSILRDLAADKARSRGSWDCEDLQAALAERGVQPSVPRGSEDEGDDEDKAEREALKQELKIHRRNLRTLRQQATVYGAGGTPLRLINQIEHEETMIRDIERRLSESGGGR